jgi:hypothetical protein
MALTKEQFQALRDKGLSVEQIVKFESGESPKKQETVSQKLSQVLIGAGKGVISTAKGLSSLGEKAIQAPLKAVGMKFPKESSAQQLQSIVEKKSNLPQGSLTTATTPLQKAGKFVEQVAEFAIPATKLEKAISGAKLGTKLLSRAATSGAIATAQEGKIGKESVIAAGTELLLPGVGKVAKTVVKPVTGVIGRLFTGLGAGLSGASTETIQTIASNPKTAREISKKILNQGQEYVLENNARTIIDGVSGIKKQAGEMYAKGLESLKQTDIKPDIIKNKVKSVLNENGINVTNGVVDLSKSDITDNAISKKVTEALNLITNDSLTNGKTLRNSLKEIESLKFKTVGADPNRLSFNAFINQLSSGIKNGINESTDKLNEINKAYSTDMSLAQGVEKIFGKVKFKNTSELNNVAKKLESLFSQKGLDPKTVDKFLTRIGVSPESFKTSEAVRTITTKTTGANTKGLSVGELIQQVTSAVVTPNAVKNIAIATGLAESVIKSIVKNTSPTVRATIIKGLINDNK